MGLLAPIILGALLIIAFALTSQQKLAIASFGGPMPARQIAYLMRVHHQSAIKQQLAAPSPGEEVDLAPPTMAINENLFVSCLYGKIVATGIFTSGTGAAILSPADANAVVAELKRQTILSPELGMQGSKPWAVGYGGATSPLIVSSSGIGLMGDSGISPAVPCAMPAGVPVIVTQVQP